MDLILGMSDQAFTQWDVALVGTIRHLNSQQLATQRTQQPTPNNGASRKRLRSTRDIWQIKQ